jgi:hypothetical protein
MNCLGKHRVGAEYDATICLESFPRNEKCRVSREAWAYDDQASRSLADDIYVAKVVSDR